jgi:hypothetical protein
MEVAMSTKPRSSSPPIPIHLERHSDGAVSIVLRLGRRAVVLDATERDEVLVRVYDRRGRTWPRTAEATLSGRDAEQLADVLPMRRVPRLPEAA